MSYSRRSVLSALGLALPLGLGERGPTRAAAATPPALRFRPFEDAVRAAFAGATLGTTRRIEVGHSEAMRLGVQGSHNARPFAGLAAGRLRIVRTSQEPGPVVGGVRLLVSTVDVVLTDGPTPDAPSRPLDFAIIAPAPVLG